MNSLTRLALLWCAAFLSTMRAESPIALAIHGGAGALRAELGAEQEAAARKALHEALGAGWKILQAGGSGLDATTACVVALEDSPLFNAGRGSVLTADGRVEMDASIMDGATRKAGAAAGVQGVRNPIRLARLIMEKTPHVMLIGKGAEDFARAEKLAFEPLEWFVTPARVEQLKRAKEKAAGKSAALHLGTVGAVALDRQGHLAAATSTGGLANKFPGRVGDSPIIGAGTYAEDGFAAISCTGHGEDFIRAAVAHDVVARMKYLRSSLEAASREVIEKELPKIGGDGGLIAVDAAGRVSMPFNTPGMFRAWMGADGVAHVAIFLE